MSSGRREGVSLLLEVCNSAKSSQSSYEDLTAGNCSGSQSPALRAAAVKPLVSGNGLVNDMAGAKVLLKSRLQLGSEELRTTFGSRN